MKEAGQWHHLSRVKGSQEYYLLQVFLQIEQLLYCFISVFTGLPGVAPRGMMQCNNQSAVTSSPLLIARYGLNNVALHLSRMNMEAADPLLKMPVARLPYSSVCSVVSKCLLRRYYCVG